jgi:hypothetical protein
VVDQDGVVRHVAEGLAAIGPEEEIGSCPVRRK